MKLNINHKKFEEGILHTIRYLSHQIECTVSLGDIKNKTFLIQKCIELFDSVENEYDRLSESSLEKKYKDILLSVLKAVSEFNFSKAKKIIKKNDINIMVFGPPRKLFLGNSIDNLVDYFLANKNKFYFPEEEK